MTVSRPGLPPPGGLPQTTSFSSPSDVARVTTALNGHHIVKVSPSSSTGCAGGEQIEIKITPADSAAVDLSAYRCANQTTGNIGGDLPGFLSAISVST